jgi:hypothetical protein
MATIRKLATAATADNELCEPLLALTRTYTHGSQEGTVAIRNEDGVWTLQSAQPALPGSVVSGTEVPTVVESDGTVRTVG